MTPIHAKAAPKKVMIKNERRTAVKKVTSNGVRPHVREIMERRLKDHAATWAELAKR